MHINKKFSISHRYLSRIFPYSVLILNFKFYMLNLHYYTILFPCIKPPLHCMYSFRMNLQPQRILIPNLEAVLHDEFEKFILLHQPSVFCLKNDVYNKSVRPFFKNKIFPLAEKWISNITGVASSEVSSLLSITVDKERSLSIEEQDKIKQMVIKSREINTSFVLTNMKNKLPLFIDRFGFNINLFLPLWWMGVKEVWHYNFVSSFINSLKIGFDEKIQVTSGVFNFTDHVICPRLLSVLEKGRKYIPHIRDDDGDATDRFKAEIINQALWYSWRIEGRKVQVDPSMSCRDVLTLLLSGSTTERDCCFYKTLLDNLALSVYHISQNVSGGDPKPDFESERHLMEVSSIKGCVWNHVDKGRGLLLIEAVKLREKEIAMMESLEATMVDLTADTILDEVFKKENFLRSGLSSKQSKFLRKFRPLRRNQAVLSFMKIQAKLHKLTKVQILMKDVDALKFRPVNDSMFFPTKPAARALLQLLRDLLNNIIDKFPNLSKLLPTSGWDVAKELQVTPAFSNKPFSVFYSADLGDAYSNCNLSDLVNAASLLFAVVDDADTAWRLDLTIKLATFVFTNNFVEAGGCIWLCGDKLPMGCVASGEALDCICLAGEVVNLCGVSDKLRMVGPDYLRGVTEIISVDSYSRYRDDIKVMVSSEDPEKIISNLKRVSKNMFPPHIPITLEISIFAGCFLDCMFFKNVSTNYFSMTTRLNLSAPNTWADSSSCSPQRFLTASFMSNAIRAYRITNEDRCFQQYISFVQMEMKNANFSDKVVSKTKDKVFRHIKDHFDPETLRSTVVKTNNIHCKPTTYSPSSRSDLVLRGVMKKALKASGRLDVVKLPGTKVGRKLQNIVFTKASHKKTMSKLFNLYGK